MLPDEFQYVLCGTVFRIETNTRIDFDSEHWTFVLCLKKDSANLEECFCTGCPGLKHDGENGEDDDLDGGAARVPVGAADSVLACHCGALQQGGGPGPLGDDGGGGQPDGDLAPRVESRVQVVRVAVNVFSHHLESLGDEDSKDADTEEDEQGRLEADRRLHSLGHRRLCSRLQNILRTLGRLKGGALNHHLRQVG